jgi:tetratricopeptide (TPR) repeat protein
MKRALVLVLLVTWAAISQARLTDRLFADSLQKQLPTLGDDTNKVKLLNTIAYLFHNINPDSGIMYAEWARSISQQLPWKKGEGMSLHAIGYNQEAKTHNVEALDYYLKALRVFEELGEKRNIASTMGNIGNVYTSLEKYEKALEFDTAALEVYTSIKDVEGQLRNLGNIALVYQGLNKYTKAHQYFAMAIDKATRSGNQAEYAKNLGNQGILYYLEGNLAAAMRYTSEALAIYETGKFDKKGLASTLGNMGEFCLASANDSSASPAARTAYLGKAIGYLNKGVAVSREIQFYEGLIGCHELLAKVHEKAGNAALALTNIKKYFYLKDSIYSSNFAIKIADLEAKRARERAIDQEKLAKTQKASLEFKNTVERFVYIPGIILLLLAVGVVTRNFLNQVRSNRLLAKEKNKHLKRIKVQSDVLMDIAHIQSHELRGPISTMLGLSQLFNYEDPADPVNIELMEGISTLAKRLDKIVTDVVSRENSLLNNDTEEPEA